MAKILWIIHGAELYGENRAIRSLMHGVRDSGWQVEALSLTEGNCYQQLLQDGLNVTSLHMGHTPSMHLAHSTSGRMGQFVRLVNHQFSIRRNILREIRARRPDGVHVLSKNILPAVGWAAKAAHVPSFWEMTAIIGNHFVLGLNRTLYRRLLSRYDIQVLANSQYTAQTLPPLRRPVQVMHLGADARQFDPAKPSPITRKELGIPADALVYVIVSRIDATKGQAVFLEAMGQLQDPRVHVLLVGGPTNPEDLHIFEKTRLALDPATRARVHMVGLTAQPQAYTALSDVGVNARLDGEPFGLSVVEAMMMGKPMLVHALGGPAETVIDGVTGWHVQGTNVQSLVQGLRRSLSDRHRWNDMSAAARSHALKSFSLETQTRHYRAIVERTLTPPPSK